MSDSEESEYWDEDHVWNEDETKCTLCGYENACQHENAYLDEWVEYVGAAEAVDETTHRAMVEVYHQMYCPDCGLSWGEVTTDAPEERVLEHEWDEENGRTCWVCGYENPCQHENAYLEEWYDYVDGTAEAVDETTHRAMVEVHHRMYCPDCDLWWGETTTDAPEERVLEHEWDEENGRTCWVCGYENPCQHENAYLEEWYDYVDGTAEAVDETTHRAMVEVHHRMYCPDCDLWWGETTTDAPE
ncbi:MAG: hypothetical protein Q4E13_00720, partial [Clostridia bacterium]|nr:hypothetical protein [Clostridia bacterium]